MREETDIDRALERSLESGEPAALAVIVGGASAHSELGARLLVWGGGEAFGDLGSPRLNQRVALYAEGLLIRGGSERKSFEVPEGELEIETTVHGHGKA